MQQQTHNNNNNKHNARANIAMGRRRKSNWMHSTRRPFDGMQTEIIGSCNGSNSSDNKNNNNHDRRRRSAICVTAADATVDDRRYNVTDAAAVCDRNNNTTNVDNNNNNRHRRRDYKNVNKNKNSWCRRSGSGRAPSTAGNNCDFFNLATILFTMFMIVNVQLSSGLIELQTEKEKHGKCRTIRTFAYFPISPFSFRRRENPSCANGPLNSVGEFNQTNRRMNIACVFWNDSRLKLIAFLMFASLFTDHRDPSHENLDAFQNHLPTHHLNVQSAVETEPLSMQCHFQKCSRHEQNDV